MGTWLRGGGAGADGTNPQQMRWRMGKGLASAHVGRSHQRTDFALNRIALSGLRRRHH